MKKNNSLQYGITFLDYLLLPLYLFIIYTIFKRTLNKNYPENHPWRSYFINGFRLKITGAIVIGLIYQYYYKGGDTFNYFSHAKIINNAFFESPSLWLQLITHTADTTSNQSLIYIDQLYWYDASTEYMVAQITSIVSLLGLGTYLTTSAIFGAFAFSGSWALFKTFTSLRPQLAKHIAVCILYLPSTIMWGSGIFKDTICLFALGWLSYTSINLFVRRKFSLKHWGMLLLSIYLLISIKLYILLAFTPGLMIWLLFNYTQKISSSFIRALLNIGIIVVAGIGFISFLSIFAEDLGKYSLENMIRTSEVTRDWINYVSGEEGGSAYDLGTIDPTPIGMLKKLPAAVNVTLYRPYLWESKKPMVLLNAIEVFFFLWYSLKLLFSVGIFKIINTIRKDPNVQFFFIFTIIFAFAVGLSSFNFGALSRYRVPCLPFFTMMLVFIYYDNKPLSKNFLSLNLFK